MLRYRFNVVKLLLAVLLPFFCMASSATTLDECRKRVMTSMENASALGGTDTDKFRWAEIAAADCSRDLATKQPASSPLLGWTVLTVCLLLVATFAYKRYDKRNSALEPTKLAALQAELFSLLSVRPGDSKAFRDHKSAVADEVHIAILNAIDGKQVISPAMAEHMRKVAHQEVSDFAAVTAKKEQMLREALRTTIAVRESAMAYLALPADEEGETSPEEAADRLETRKMISDQLEKALADIARREEELADLRPSRIGDA